MLRYVRQRMPCSRRIALFFFSFSESLSLGRPEIAVLWEICYKFDCILMFSLPVEFLLASAPLSCS